MELEVPDEAESAEAGAVTAEAAWAAESGAAAGNGAALGRPSRFEWAGRLPPPRHSGLVRARRGRGLAGGVGPEPSTRGRPRGSLGRSGPFGAAGGVAGPERFARGRQDAARGARESPCSALSGGRGAADLGRE